MFERRSSQDLIIIRVMMLKGLHQAMSLEIVTHIFDMNAVSRTRVVFGLVKLDEAGKSFHSERRCSTSAIAVTVIASRQWIHELGAIVVLHE